MKAILTRQNPDGTFDEVGMNNRMLIETKRALVQTAQAFGNGRKVRVEYFAHGIYAMPSMTIVLEGAR